MKNFLHIVMCYSILFISCGIGWYCDKKLGIAVPPIYWSGGLVTGIIFILCIRR